MKKFEVVVHYEGAISYEVEAQTKNEAKQIAEKMFGDESDTIIAAKLPIVIFVTVGKQRRNYNDKTGN